MLENGTNLDNIKNAGNYYSYNSDSTATMSNVPVAGSGFNLLVFSYPNSNNNPTIQVFWKNNNTSYVMFRICNYGGSWGEWRSLATTNDLSSYLTRTTADSLYATQAALGSYYTKTQVDSKITSINSTTSNLQTQITTNKNNISSINSTVSNHTTALNNLGAALTGTNRYSSAFSMDTSALTWFASLSLPKGLWFLEAVATWNSSGGDTSYRAVYISTYSSGDNARSHAGACGAASSGNTSVRTQTFVNPSATTTYYANAMTGHAATFQPGLSGLWARRIK